ncbi:hypothetical protein T4B_9657, partial [Trichinella pseudospiralis]
MIRHRYGDHYLHNGALEIIFRELQLFECILLIGHFIFMTSKNNLKNKKHIMYGLEDSAKVSSLTT